MSDQPNPDTASAHPDTAIGTGQAQAAAVIKPGQMTQDQLQKALAFVTEHWGLLGNCPFHGQTKWVLDVNLGHIPGYAPGAPFGSSGLTFPVLIVTCQVCGFIVPINAIKAGVVEADAPEVHESAGDLPDAEAS
jgi:hypothetical protein